jgi:aurora kinase
MCFEFLFHGDEGRSGFSQVDYPLRDKTNGMIEWKMKDFTVLDEICKKPLCVLLLTRYINGMFYVLKVYNMRMVPTNMKHMLDREVEIMKQLDHPNIIKLYAAFVEGKHLCLVLEYGEEDLKSFMNRKNIITLTEDHCKEVVLRGLMSAVQYMHNKHICHRDIKPENILIMSKNERCAKLVDFGTAIDLTKEKAVTKTGTEEYMAPEVRMCPLKSNPTSNKADDSLWYGLGVDIWSIGILTYELLVGKPPDPDLPIFPHYCSPNAISFIRACMKKRPRDRPTIDELMNKSRPVSLRNGPLSRRSL